MPKAAPTFNNRSSCFLQLEEFRKKKEAALAARKLSASSNIAPSIDDKMGGINGQDSWKEREESLQSQVSELLASIDDLHRALNDERHNSSELENTISELRTQIHEIKHSESEQTKVLEVELNERVSEVDELRLRVQALERELVDVQASSAGEKDFIEGLQNTIQELQSLNEEMESKLQTMQELEAENSHLKAECDGISVLHQELADCKNLIVSRENDINILRKEIENMASDKEDTLKSVQEEYELTISQLRQEMEQLASAQQADTKQAHNLEAELNELMNQLEQMLQERQAMETEKEDILRISENAQARLQAIEAELVEAANVAEEAVKRKEEILQELEIMTEQSNALTKLKDSLEAENISQKAQIESLRASSSAPSHDIEQLESTLENERNERLKLENEVERLKEIDAVYTNQISDFESRCEVAEGKCTELQRIVDTLREQESSMKAKNLEMEQKMINQAQIQQPTEDISSIKQRNSVLETEIQSLRTGMQSKIEEKDHKLSLANAELENVKEQLNSEKRRSSQLEDFVTRSKQVAPSSLGTSGKKMDDEEDMEAAALAGGSAFKPLVGLVRSLPHPLGNNNMLVNIALKIDKGVVALDARPQYRALFIIYLILVHIFLLI